LGAGASEADVVNYTKQLMAANPNLGDPRTLQAGTSVNLPDANTPVTAAAEAAYNKSDAGYQTYRAEQAAQQGASGDSAFSDDMARRAKAPFGNGLKNMGSDPNSQLSDLDIAKQVSDLASKTGAILEAVENVSTGAAKAHANSILMRANPLHAGRIERIIAADTLSDAQAVIKTSTAQSAVAMERFAGVVKYADKLGTAGTLIEFAADMYVDPSVATIVAGEANILAAAGSTAIGAKIGASIGLVGGPAAPITVPLFAGIGAAAGAIIYEFGIFGSGSGSNWVKTNVKQWTNTAIQSFQK
jgi:hypothetical protein